MVDFRQTTTFPRPRARAAEYLENIFILTITKVFNMADISERQASINTLYAAYRNAGDDDVNARGQVADYIQQLIEAPIKNSENFTAHPDKWDLEKYLQNARPVDETELDTAARAYGQIK